MSTRFEQPLHQLHSCSRVMEKLGGPYSLEKTKQKINENENHWLKYGFGLWCCLEEDSNELMGRGGMRYQQLDDGETLLEVAYLFFEKYWNQGLATELTLYCIDLALHHYEFEKISALVIPENIASRRVLEKAGMSIEREHVHFRGNRNFLYSIAKNYNLAG